MILSKPYTNISVTDAINTLFFYFSIHPRRSAHTWLSITETASSLGEIRIVFIYSMYKYHLLNCDIRDFITYIFSGQNPSLHNDDVSKDPLFITTRLLSDALTRLRIFVFGLDPMQWLSWRDRNVLYTSQICCLAVLKASVGVGTYTCILELFHSIFIPVYIPELNRNDQNYYF